MATLGKGRGSDFPPPLPGHIPIEDRRFLCEVCWLNATTLTWTNRDDPADRGVAICDSCKQRKDLAWLFSMS